MQRSERSGSKETNHNIAAKVQRKVAQMRMSDTSIITAFVVSILVSIGLMGLVPAHGKDHHGKKGAYPPVDQQSGQPATIPEEARPAQIAMGPLSNALYKEQCGACHFAYQPELLPSGSWQRILGKLDDHFGEVLPLAPEMIDEITTYLEANAAERSREKRAVKIVNSLQGATPLRITEVPYIVNKHRKISPDVLRRPSIGSLSNCVACHRTAANGVYNDDSVSIPK